MACLVLILFTLIEAPVVKYIYIYIYIYIYSIAVTDMRVIRSHNIPFVVHVFSHCFMKVYYSNVVKTPPSLSVVPGLLGE
jgi:hypothetical protein